MTSSGFQICMGGIPSDKQSRNSRLKDQPKDIIGTSSEISMATLIAEIGINHLGDNSKLQAMICELADAGVDACKLQYRSPTDFFAESLEMGSTLISQELDAVHLDLDSYIEAHALARAKGIKIGISFFKKADAEFYLEHVSPDFVKVPSAEALNFDLINSLLEKPFPILVSTGGLTWAQLKTLANRVSLDLKTV